MKEQGRFQVLFLRDPNTGAGALRARRRRLPHRRLRANSGILPPPRERDHGDGKTQASANAAIARRVDGRPEVVSIDTTPRRVLHAAVRIVSRGP